MTHPKTGHDCSKPKLPEWPLPNQEVTIRISRDVECVIEPLYSGCCNVGTQCCRSEHDMLNGEIWYAEISGIIRKDGQDEPWGCFTHGETIVHAAEMAADLLRLQYETCKNQGIEHCYCRDVTWVAWFSDEGAVSRAKECCLCLTKTRIEEFLP